MNPEKLKEILLAKGIDEETADEIVAEVKDEVLDQASDDVDTDTDGKPVDDVPPADVPPSDGDVPPGDDDTGDDDGDVPPEGDVPPVDAPVDVPPEVVPPVDDALPPTDDVLPPSDVPVTPDPELINKIEEQAKVIDGLTARITSLEDALKKSGILTEDAEVSEIGDDSSHVTPSASVDADDAFDSVLNEIKSKGRKY